MTDKEQRIVLQRGVTAAVCVVAVGAAMPAISAVDAAKRAEGEARLKASLFAELGDGASAVRAMPAAPSLLAHPWLVRVEHSLEHPEHAALGRYAARDRDYAALSSLASFEVRHLNEAETIAAEHKCMAEAVYYEARSERTSGQLAVAEVVANRVRDRRYPNSVCDVVYQGATRTTGCQFTFTCDGSMALKPRGERWEKAKAVAAQVMLDLHERRTGQATHYHADYVDPIWNSGLVKTERIGAHIFYRFPRGTEWVDAREALALRRASMASGIRPAQLVSADAPAAIKSGPPPSADDLNRRSLQAIAAAPAP